MHFAIRKIVDIVIIVVIPTDLTELLCYAKIELRRNWS